MSIRSHSPGQSIVHSRRPFVQCPTAAATQKNPAPGRVWSIWSRFTALGRPQRLPIPNNPRSRERIDSDMPSTARSGSKSVFSPRSPCTNFCAAGSMSCSVIVFSNAIDRVLSSDGHTLPERYVQWRAVSLNLARKKKTPGFATQVGGATLKYCEGHQGASHHYHQELESEQT